MKRISIPIAFLLVVLFLAISCQRDEAKPETNEQEGTVTGLDGREYRWQEMADGKIWLLENLRFDVQGYESGWYENEEANAGYGRLYDWEAAKAACSALGEGWRLPADREWLGLINRYGGMETAYDSLREGGGSGFDALLGGVQRYFDGSLWRFLGQSGFYWSSTAVLEQDAWYYIISDNIMRWNRSFDTQWAGMSCRCIKGEEEEAPEVEAGTIVLADGKTWTTTNLDISPPGFEDGAWWYENDEAAYGAYGRLYNWRAAIAACAELGGKWRLPGNEDWMALVGAYGGFAAAYGALIEGGSSGLDARFGGQRDRDGNFERLGDFGIYWSSTEGEPRYEYDENAYAYWFDAVQDTLGRDHLSDNKSWGYSCRCLKE